MEENEVTAPLTRATAAHDLEEVQALVQTGYVDSDQSWMIYDSRTAMNMAIDGDDFLLVDELMGKGIKPTISNFVTAVKNQSYPILELILLGGYDINACDRIDFPPPLANAYFDPELVRWLIEHGADPNAQCRYDVTPLSMAVARGTKQVIELFFELGASIERGQPLHHAVQANRENDIIELLLEKGASPNAIMFQDHPTSFYQFECIGLGTPLHDAIRQKNNRLIQLLLKHGADPMIRNTCRELAQVKRAPFGAAL